MQLDNPIVQLCLRGTQAEFHGELQQAHALYQEAWVMAQDDYEACVAAHYLGHILMRLEAPVQERLHWHQEALKRANQVSDERVKPFYFSLYVNLKNCHELLNNLEEAQRYDKLVRGLVDTDPANVTMMRE
ncbi:MAG: hypothetical protein R3C62_17775 [Chloroflexota bacterium]